MAVPNRNKDAAVINSALLPIFLSPAIISTAEAAVAPKRDDDATCPIWSGSSVPKSVIPEPRILVTDEDPPISEPNNSPPKAAVPNAGSHGGREELKDVAGNEVGVDLESTIFDWHKEVGRCCRRECLCLLDDDCMYASTTNP